jgi:sensor histidine kinase YesM
MSSATSPLPEQPLRALRDPHVWLFSLIFWTVLGILNSASEVIDVIAESKPYAVWEPMVWEMSSSYGIAALFPALIALTLARRITRTTWARSLAWHLPAMIAFSVAHVVFMVGARKLIYLLMGSTYEFGDLRLELLYELFKDIVSYWILVALIHGFDYYRRYQQRQQETLRLQKELATARLAALRHRLQPHFLFNTLNTISATMHRDVAAADNMISRLSDLLRLSLDHADEPTIPLRHELELLDAYFDIMRARFGSSLKITTRIAPLVLDTPVPPLILQPLVENAIKHGISHRAGGGRLEISAAAGNGVCTLRVCDDGPGVEDPQQVWGQGLGLSETAERLQTLYGKGNGLRVGNREQGGFEVSFELPLVTAASLTGEGPEP